MMIKTTNNAKKLISYKNVDEKKQLDLKSLKQMMEMLKAAISIAYPNFDGLGDWEPAKLMAEGSFDYTNVNTNQIDVTIIRFSTWIRKTPQCGGQARSSIRKSL